MPPTFTPDIQPTILKYTDQILLACVYGAFTLYGKTFQSISTSHKRTNVRTYNTTSTHNYSQVFSLSLQPFSLAVTNGIAYCFLFLCLLRCFNSAGSRS